MSNREHLMGYPPAANEFFTENPFDLWDCTSDYPLGLPKRVLEQADAQMRSRSYRDALMRTPILRINHTSMTARDIIGASVLRARAILHARPIAEALGLRIDSHQDTGQSQAVRAVEPDEPVPAIEGGYEVDFNPYKRYDPVAMQNVGRAIAEVTLRNQSVVDELEQRLNRWDAERADRIAKQDQQNVQAVQMYNNDVLRLRCDSEPDCDYH